MEPVKYMRADTKLAQGPTDLSQMLGIWLNADSETDNIARFVLAEKDDTLTIRAYAADSPGLADWGEIRAAPFVVGETLQGAGFIAQYVFDASETVLAANYAKGVLVIQAFTTFKNGGGRPSHFSREFFHQ